VLNHEVAFTTLLASFYDFMNALISVGSPAPSLSWVILACCLNQWPSTVVHAVATSLGDPAPLSVSMDLPVSPPVIMTDLAPATFSSDLNALSAVSSDFDLHLLQLPYQHNIDSSCFANAE